MPPRLHAYNPPLDLHASMPPRLHSCKAHPVPPCRYATTSLQLHYDSRVSELVHSSKSYTPLDFIPPYLHVYTFAARL